MPKKIIFLLFIVFNFLVSFAQTEERAPNGPRSVRNKRDELNRKQEVWKTYNSYGDLVSEIEYKNDKKEGKSLIYYFGEGERVREEANYFDGKKDGSYVRKYLSGQIAIEGEYELKTRVGLWTSYYEDGQIKTEGKYLKGRKDGVWKTYNRKGTLKSAITYPIQAKPAPAKKKDTSKKTDNKPASKK